MSRLSGRQKRTPRGVHLSVHNKADREAADQALRKREREERRQAALDEIQAEQERLERRIEREKTQPAMGATLGAQYVSPTPEPELVEPVEPELVQPTSVDTPAWMIRFPDLPWEGDGNEKTAIGRARSMLREGYNVRKVVTMFQVGLKWLDDIEIDDMGFGVTHK